MTKPRVDLLVTTHHASDFEVVFFKTNGYWLSPPIVSERGRLHVHLDDKMLLAEDHMIQLQVRGIERYGRIYLLAWSSEFVDDLSTPVDERWRELASKAIRPGVSTDFGSVPFNWRLK